MDLINNFDLLYEPQTAAISYSWEEPKKAYANLSVIGLGYVGLVSIACFSKMGVNVIGMDTDFKKVDTVNSGKSPIVEAYLPEFLEAGLKTKHLEATTSIDHAIRGSDVSFVSVGTPSAPDGSCDLSYLEKASSAIGESIGYKDDYHVVVYRSTIPPGSTRDVLIPILESSSGKVAGVDFGVAFHPEFLRESTAIDDFNHPSKTVIGGIDQDSIDAVKAYYEDIEGPMIETSIEVAEMVKYVDNNWHAVKVSFANEIGKICQGLSIDSHAVMDIFKQDKKLNLSAYYMTPGFAFGGSCLPKDVRGMNHMAESMNIDTPLLRSVNHSNLAQIEHALNLIESAGSKSVGLLGLTFKSGTDDLRESPMLHLAEILLQSGYDLTIHDVAPNLENSLRHHLAHSLYKTDSDIDLLSELPSRLTNNLKKVIKSSQTLVIGHNSDEYVKALTPHFGFKAIIDLAGALKSTNPPEKYTGICW